MMRRSLLPITNFNVHRDGTSLIIDVVQRCSFARKICPVNHRVTHRGEIKERLFFFVIFYNLPVFVLHEFRAAIFARDSTG